ncbi:RNA helicase [Cetacean poxvirus 1]|nr:RNA helicase [Cetacean poxvirus 1]
MDNLPNIYYFPNNVTIFAYYYSQDEFDNMNQTERFNFSFSVFSIIKHRWYNAYIIEDKNTLKLNIELKTISKKNNKKIDAIDIIRSPNKINKRTKEYTLDNDKKISFECYSFVKCFNKTIKLLSFDDYILRGLLEAGNCLKIFSNNTGNASSSVSIFNNELPFSKVTLITLTSEYQRQIFKHWSSNYPVILTGGTGVGKTSQVPKLLLWFNYLFGGFRDLSTVTLLYNERPIVLSLPRISLVKLHSMTLLHSLGFTKLEGSPVSIRFGSITKEYINTRPKKYGIIFSTHKLTLSKLFEYGTVIVDEVHEHDQIGDILIAVVRKHMNKFDSMFLMTATLEDDRDRLKIFLHRCRFIHIPGERLFPVSEVYIQNKVNPSDNIMYIEEEKRNIVLAIKKYTPPPGSSGILFVSSVSQCNVYSKYLKTKVNYNIYIIHGKIPNIEQTLQDIYSDKDVSIIVSTPYLESSVTINNATHVYDTGRVYIPKPFGGNQYTISKAMREQRKGRVGRVKPGTYVYFYDISKLSIIKRIDNEFLHNYILYAKYFNLKLPDDLFIIPNDLSYLHKTYEYLDSFDINNEQWFYILSNHYLLMIEYARIYKLGGRISSELDTFERDGILSEDVYKAITSLYMKAKIINVKKKGKLFIHKCEILFGPFTGFTFTVSNKNIFKDYILMITEHTFVKKL